MTLKNNRCSSIPITSVSLVGSPGRLLCRVQLLQQDARGVRHLSQQPTTRKPRENIAGDFKVEDSLNQGCPPFHMSCHIYFFRQIFAPKGASLDMKGIVWLDLPLVGSQKLSASTVSNRACLVVSLAPAWSWLLDHMAHIAIQMPKTQCALRPNKHLYFALSMIKKSKSNKMEARL